MCTAERLNPRETRSHFSTPWPAHQAVGRPPLIPAAAGGLSGRPRCRIFPVDRFWVLQVETASGWLLGNGADEPPMRLTFPTLAAAVAYAEQHGYDYRITTPGQVEPMEPSRRITARRGGRAITRPARGRSTKRTDMGSKH
jgi:hypothetical protein